MKKIIFITGTRADYSKIKSIILELQKNKKFDVNLYVTGMHNLKKYGSTYNEIIKDNIKNIHIYKNQNTNSAMDEVFSKTSFQFGNFLKKIKPDLVVVHGDRVEALACSVIACLNNVKVAHIEGGEISGTVDEMMRHSISKIANIHFVSNKVARKRLLQMGEHPSSIFVIGSPDIDIILSKNLPNLEKVKKRYDINFDNYAIAILHPVTTEIRQLDKHANIFVKTLIDSKINYVIIYPNNDKGNEIIHKKLEKIKNHARFKLFSSIRFEYFLTLLKNCKFIVGNSSTGIIEAPYYGVPTINLGNRQRNRAKISSVLNSKFDKKKILFLINKVLKKKYQKIKYFGFGNSKNKFINIIKNNKRIWNNINQKYFNEID